MLTVAGANFEGRLSAESPWWRIVGISYTLTVVGTNFEGQLSADSPWWRIVGISYTLTVAGANFEGQLSADSPWLHILGISYTLTVYFERGTLCPKTTVAGEKRLILAVKQEMQQAVYFED